MRNAARKQLKRGSAIGS